MLLSSPRHVVSRPPFPRNASDLPRGMCSSPERGHRGDFPLARYTELTGNRITIEGPKLMCIKPNRPRLKSHVSDSLPQVIPREFRKFPISPFDQNACDIDDDG